MEIGFTLIGIGIALLSVSISFYLYACTIDIMFITKERRGLTKYEYKSTPQSFEGLTDSTEDDILEQEYIEALQSQPFYKDMDARIEKMKMELAEANIQSYEETIADELHPGVYNIPHDEVNEEREARIKYGDEVSN